MAFEWKTSEYSYYNLPDNSVRTLGKQRIMIEYADMNVDINHEVRMVDFNTFVSSVGGAMGLFLGFSIIDSLLYFYSHIFRTI